LEQNINNYRQLPYFISIMAFRKTGRIFLKIDGCHGNEKADDERLEVAF
jgi:hypothetical protein